MRTFRCSCISNLSQRVEESLDRRPLGKLRAVQLYSEMIRLTLDPSVAVYPMCEVSLGRTPLGKLRTVGSLDIQIYSCGSALEAVNGGGIVRGQAQRIHVVK